MPFTARQQSLIDELMHLHDSHERLSAVVDRARKSARFSAAERIAPNRVAGCTSTVWLISEMREGRCYFRADADSPVVRGLVDLLVTFFSGARPAEIFSTSADPLETLDLSRSLSGTRRNGLAAVRAAIWKFASESLKTDGKGAPVLPDAQPRE